MNKLYKIELDKIETYVEFEAPDNLEKHELVELAIKEATQKTYIYRLKKEEIK